MHGFQISVSHPLGIFTGELEALTSRSATPLAVIVGPTASGKTAFSIALGLELKQRGIKTEIINADSRQCYKHLDIGTAKIRDEEMQGIPHHLLSVIDPREKLTAAWYQEHAHGAIREIQRRGALPLLVGGSMLYISSVIDGLKLLPPVDPEFRRNLESLYEADGGLFLFALLREIDPETTAGIHPNNKPYVIRALEIYETMWKKPSVAKEKSASPHDLCIVGVRCPREELTQRIDERTRSLLKNGWIEEVRSLLARGYLPSDPGMESHGYREIMEAINSGDVDPKKLAEEISSRTRQYAKRQVTWWKNDHRIHWIDIPNGLPREAQL